MIRSGHFDLNRLLKEGFLTASPRTHGGRHYVKNVRGSIMDFSTNINPLGASPKVMRIIRENLHLISSYPDPESREFKRAVSEYLKVDEECITAGNGANELVHLFADAFVKKGGNVVIPMPTFYEYEFACDKNSANITYVDLANLEFDSNSVLDAIGRDTRVVFICNPNNPTGVLADRDAVEDVIEKAYRNNAIVLLDECFMEFVDEPEKNSFSNMVKEYENLVVLRTLTKAFGLAGLRAGYCVASRKISHMLNKVKVPWSVNALAQKAAAAALQDREHLNKTRMLVKREREYLQSNIKKFTPCRSDANFFLLKLNGIDSISLKEKLLKKNILVRDCSTFTGMGTDYVRISAQRRKENLMLIRALKEI